MSQSKYRVKMKSVEFRYRSIRGELPRSYRGFWPSSRFSLLLHSLAIGSHCTKLSTGRKAFSQKRRYPNRSNNGVPVLNGFETPSLVIFDS